jgi:hypothetical protein
MLADRGVTDVTIDRADEPPQRESGGKLRRIIPSATASARRP